MEDADQSHSAPRVPWGLEHNLSAYQMTTPHYEWFACLVVTADQLDYT